MNAVRINGVINHKGDVSNLDLIESQYRGYGSVWRGRERLREVEGVPEEDVVEKRLEEGRL